MKDQQLIPIEGGLCLLQLALDRLDGLVEPGARLVCAGEKHRAAMARRVSGLAPRQYLGEPEGRDTLAAVGFAATVIAGRDPDAVVGIFTADQVIRPHGLFRQIVAQGYELVEADAGIIVTFGITPTHPATSYGYLELAEAIGGTARRVSRFLEKPDLPTAERFVSAGAERYLWSSGMFVFRAATLLERLESYEAQLAASLRKIGESWGTGRETAVLEATYPSLRKVSFDYGFMERASVDPAVRVAAIPMALEWLDVGSWPSFAAAYPPDSRGNTVAAGKHVLEGCSGTLLVSDDPEHLVAAMGCEDLIIVHTGRSTLVCRKDRAEDVKKLQSLVAERYGEGYL